MLAWHSSVLDDSGSDDGAPAGGGGVAAVNGGAAAAAVAAADVPPRPRLAPGSSAAKGNKGDDDGDDDDDIDELLEQQLLGFLARQADVKLRLDDDDGDDDGDDDAARGGDQHHHRHHRHLLPASSLILSCWSPVLADALAAERGSIGAGCCSGSSGSSSSAAAAAAATTLAAPVLLPLPGVTRKQFLQAAAFMYPTLPPPSVTWRNAEALLLLGARYDMAALLQRADRWLRASTGALEAAPDSRRYVWRWARLADAAGLDAACRACLERAVSLSRTDGAAAAAPFFTEGAVAGLSARALTTLVLGLASSQSARNAAAAVQQCPRCGCSRTIRVKCGYCAHEIVSGGPSSSGAA